MQCFLFADNYTFPLQFNCLPRKKAAVAPNAVPARLNTRINMKSKFHLPNFFRSALILASSLIFLTSQAQLTVTQISASDQPTFSLFLKSDGSLWGMGDNQYGMLGITNTVSLTNRPVQAVIFSNDVTAISAGGSFTLFLRRDGSLWGMGDNDYGQINSTVFHSTNAPQLITNGVTAFAAGYNSTYFIRTNGSLWSMGYNYFGELGDGNYNNTNQPQEIASNGVTAVSAGFEHALFLKSDGSLWAMGNNEEGQLGDDSNKGSVQVTNLPDLIIPSGVSAIAGGYQFSLIIMNDGSLWSCGKNGVGALGQGGEIGTTSNLFAMVVPSGVKAIAAGGETGLFIKNDGSLWGMGGGVGLGLGTLAYTNVPVEILPSNVTAVAAGSAWTMIIKGDGSLWVTGNNGQGQLGDGSYIQTNQFEQIIAGSSLPAGYGQLNGQLLNSGNVRLSYIGLAGTNYALDRTFNLAPANWVPQTTNPAGAGGTLLLTNTPDSATNNFWRIRSVP
jgi:alpha-tubulin suppressor-like RCC1 family protein